MKRPKNKSKKSAFLGIYNDTAYALLYNGILVVEYKGAHIADSQDTKEKTLIGELWEKHMKGKGLFLLAVKNKDGKTVAEQIQAKIHAR
ncbi:MAG: hypothetical protein LBH07_02365 [Treponema sp.]|nr:hypothetical protein [Treponema sp.]